MFLVLALLFLCGDLTLATTLNRCSSISCVVSAAALVERLNVKIDPCEDFYEYACGAFADEVYTPDEKTSVDTTTLMTDKLIEVLLTLFRVPLAAQDLEIHKIVKKLFASCMMNGEVDLTNLIAPLLIDFRFADKINERGVAPMKEILTFIGGWPLIEGDGWNESDWEWETSILKLRELIAKRMNNIFAKEKQPKEEEASVDRVERFSFFTDSRFGFFCFVAKLWRQRRVFARREQFKEFYEKDCNHLRGAWYPNAREWHQLAHRLREKLGRRRWSRVSCFGWDANHKFVLSVHQEDPNFQEERKVKRKASARSQASRLDGAFCAKHPCRPFEGVRHRSVGFQQTLPRLPRANAKKVRRKVEESSS